jgi:preprotein translocase subunit SecA
MIKFISDTLGKMFGTKHDRDVKALSPIIAATNAFFEQYKTLSHDELRGKTLEFRARIAAHLKGIDADIATLNEQIANTTNVGQKEKLFAQIDTFTKDRDKELEVILLQIRPEAFAVVKETARRLSENEEIRVTATDHDRTLAAKQTTAERGAYVRIEGDEAVWKNKWIAAGNEITWNMVHYDVQLIGGAVLHDGKIAEMQTGEGKTLVATLPAYLNGLSGLGLHVVTVNDYLARRDSQWKGPLMEFLHLTCDCIDLYRPNSPERRAAYKCDIIYGTNNEFGFDYLRDNMTNSPDDLVQGKHHYAMVDEVDSVLIDDARTPLIISGPVQNDMDHLLYKEFRPIVENLYEAQRKLVTGFLTDAKRQFAAGDNGVEEGEGGLALFRAHRGLPRYRPTIKYLSEQGVKTAMQKVEDHYMQEQSKHMPKADAALLFTIEEKTNSVELTKLGNEYLSGLTNDPNFFVMPDISVALVNIQNAKDLSEEEKHAQKDVLMNDYTEKSRRLHCIQQLLKGYTLFEKEKDYIVVDDEVKIVDESTGRIMEGRRWSDGLHQAVESKENVTIHEATQTYATVTLQNYFRMYHKLCGMTGTAETEAQEFWTIYKLDVVAIPTNRAVTRQDGDDLVYKTTRAKFSAVGDEIEKMREAGRPVLVGTTSVNLSEQLSRMLSMRNIPHTVLNAKQHAKEADIVAEAGKAGAVTIATNMAGRGTDIKLGEGVKAAGGLAIIGTERHDSRRVDRQLRGRAGRQGDPGSSVFFVSLEDDLMRKFGSERLAGWMDKMGYDENEVIQHSMVSNSIERSQKKVEENNFGTRKHLLEYDDVMNIQREAIYKKRNNALFGERIGIDINNMFCDLADELVKIHRPTGDFAGFDWDVFDYFNIKTDITENEFRSQKPAELSGRIQRQVWNAYLERSKALATQVLPIIERVHAHEGDKFVNIAIPYTDGRKQMQIIANMEQCLKDGAATLTTEIEKGTTLTLIDTAWKEHLRNMDDLKESVRTASFEQKDPLVRYKIEAYAMFKGLIGQINRDVVSFLSKGEVPIYSEDDVQEAVEVEDTQEYYTNEEMEAMREEEMRQREMHRQRQQQQMHAPRAPQAPIRNEIKVGRNENCPCGSGKKFKNCHGK